MEKLLDLGKLANDLVNEYQSLYDGKEIELPNEFKSTVKDIFGSSISYQKYTATVLSPNGLKIYLSNHWFYIASFFTEYYNELQKYKAIAVDLFSSERIKTLKGSGLDELERAQILRLELDEESKWFIERFLVDYNWWGGGKTIDRGDFYVSPILNYAKLVNASQSYVADLCAFLSQNRELVNCLLEKITDKKLVKEEVIFGPTQFGSNTNGYVSFLQKVLEEIIKEDPTLSRLTSEQENYALTNNGSFSIGGCIIGKKITMVENLRDGDYDLNLKWTFNDEEYVFYKELTGEGISKFSKIYNKVYNGFYKIIEKKDDKGHYVFTFVKCVKQNIKQYNGIWNSYFSAIKTKPFVLLAGISGTGKSRIVRQLARACDNLDENPWKVQKPKNFEMIQVKPNWHDSSELLGYVSRIDGEKYVAGDFLKFIVRAWENLDTPYFLCLDEMNLAPVEQYFAEYLSVIESRRLSNETGEIETDPIVKKEETIWYQNLVDALLLKSDRKDVLKNQFMEKGITIPQNLIVMGTVNMDETTFSFSRKVLDRAMTIEMNEVNLDGGLTEEDLKKEQFTISAEDIIPQVVEGKDVYGENKNLCDRVIVYLQKVNEVLEGTPFKIAYRTRNEFLIYAVNRGVENYELAIDEMTSMKILSRIEGDAAKLLNVEGESVLDGLHKLLREEGLNVETSLSLQKINEMQKRLNTGYTSYWS